MGFFASLLGLNVHNHTGELAWVVQVPLLAKVSPAKARNVLARVRIILDAVPLEEWSALFINMRDELRWGDGEKLALAYVKNPAAFSCLAEQETLFHGIVSGMPNGYCRAAALERLALVRTGEEIPFLLLRLHDWVAPIRAAAMAFLRERLNPGHVEKLTQCYPLYHTLPLKGEADCRTIHSELIEFLSASANSEKTCAQLSGLSPRMRLKLIKEMCGASSPELPLLRQLIKEPDPITRGRILSYARRRNVPFDQFCDIEELTRQNHSAIQLELLSWMMRTGCSQTISYARSLLLSPVSNVRLTAQEALARDGVSDFVAFYTGQLCLDSYRRIAVSLEELARLGSEEHVPVGYSFLDHKSSMVRRGALAVLAAHGKTGDLTPYFSALGDKSAKVRDLARVTLAKRQASWNIDKLLSEFDQSSNEIHRLQLLLLARSLPMAERLEMILAAWMRSASSPMISDACSHGVTSWCNYANGRYIAFASKDTGQRLLGLTDQVTEATGHQLPLLRFALKGYSE